MISQNVSWDIWHTLIDNILQGKIVMMRYGKIFRARKIWNAQVAGAAGAILFSDPFEVAHDGIAKGFSSF